MLLTLGVVGLFATPAAAGTSFTSFAQFADLYFHPLSVYGSNHQSVEKDRSRIDGTLRVDSYLPRTDDYRIRFNSKLNHRSKVIHSRLGF